MTGPTPPPPPPPPPPSPGREPAGGELAQTVYAQLHAIAQQQMYGERRGHTLSATALVNEAYLRLGDHDLIRSRGKGAFFFAAAQAMRRILIERARARGRVKRGGGVGKVSLDAIGDVIDLSAVDDQGAEFTFAFDEAFGRLEEHESQVADVVRLRFYAGLTAPQAAEALGISERTVHNRWAYARAWLALELKKQNKELSADDADGRR